MVFCVFTGKSIYMEMKKATLPGLAQGNISTADRTDLTVTAPTSQWHQNQRTPVSTHISPQPLKQPHGMRLPEALISTQTQSHTSARHFLAFLPPFCQELPWHDAASGPLFLLCNVFPASWALARAAAAAAWAAGRSNVGAAVPQNRHTLLPSPTLGIFSPVRNMTHRAAPNTARS